jgi:signal transduction histidine kinase
MLNADLIREFVSPEAPPGRLWIGPKAHALYGRGWSSLFEQAEVRVADPAGGEWVGPATLLLAAEDLVGPDRGSLLELRRRALPGRIVVVGGSDHKEVLLDAINVWHAFRLLPKSAPPAALLDALRKAHSALAVDVATEVCAQTLYEECRRVDSKLEELRATQDRLLHAERLATVGRIAGALRGQTEALYRTLEGFTSLKSRMRELHPLAEHLECAAEAINSFGRLLDDLLALTDARVATTERQNELLDCLVERATRLFRYDPMARARRIHINCRSGALVGVDRYRLDHVLLNLLRNAAQATREREQIEVRTSRDDREAVIEVEDRGRGMSQETLDQIFTPFFSTKGREGLGLGLRLAKTTIEGQGGTLECTSTPGQGTCFRIRLPVAG